MHELSRLRQEPARFQTGLTARGWSGDLGELLAADDQRRGLLAEENALRHRQNVLSRRLAETRSADPAAGPPTVPEEARQLVDRLSAVTAQRRAAEGELHRRLLALPNLPDSSVPPGQAPEDDVCCREVPSPRPVPELLRPHWTLARTLGLVDRPGAARVAGRGFAVWTGTGAAVRRALGAFALALHVHEHGYHEVCVPQLVTASAATATGQLPRRRGGMYAVQGEDLFLSPKAEVGLTALDAGETLAGADLPRRRVALAECFRRQAGAAGRRDRAGVRLHQFGTVELVSLVGPDAGRNELDRMLAHVEAVFTPLELRYRVIESCAGRLSFAAGKAYRVEAWAPATGRWLTAGTAAWFADFQTRRAAIRLRDSDGERGFPHTVNATAPGLERTLAALLETYQQPDGSVAVPDALRAFL